MVWFCFVGVLFKFCCLRMKRSVGPTYWQRPATAYDKPNEPKGFKPLAEGPVISSRAPVADGVDDKAGKKNPTIAKLNHMAGDPWS